jgi:hypothetical protein
MFDSYRSYGEAKELHISHVAALEFHTMQGGEWETKAVKLTVSTVGGEVPPAVVKTVALPRSRHANCQRDPFHATAPP